MSSLITPIASLAPHTTPYDTWSSLAVLGKVIRPSAPSTPQRAAPDAGAVGLDVSRTAAAEALLLAVDRRAVGLDVTLAAAAVALLRVDGGAVGLDVPLAAAVVALLGLGRARRRAGRRLVARFETVEASSVCVAAVFG